MTRTDVAYWQTPPVEDRVPATGRAGREVERLKVCPGRWALVEPGKSPGRRRHYELAGCETRVAALRYDGKQLVGDIYARFIPEAPA